MADYSVTAQATSARVAFTVSGRDQRSADEIPAVGSILAAKYPHRLLWATDDRKVIDIPVGARFAIVQVEGGWDHTHAMVLSTYRFLFHLRILEGGRAGQIVRVPSHGEVIRLLDQEEPDSILPAWLTTLPVSPAGL